MSLPGRFSTWQPSRQYSSICASVSADARAEVRVTIGDHVDALHRRDRLDIVQALERFDRHADDDVGIGPRRILGRVTAAIAPVPGVHPLPRDAAIADRR